MKWFYARVLAYVAVGACSIVFVRSHPWAFTAQGRNQRAVRRFISTIGDSVSEFRARFPECRHFYLFDDTRRDGQVGIYGFMPDQDAELRVVRFVESLGPPRPVQSHVHVWPRQIMEDSADILARFNQEAAAREKRYASEFVP